jgi:putative SOS response-associated peptidase YedK
MKIKGSVVLVTGAIHGLGVGYFRQLLDRPASMVYAGAREIESVTNSGAVPIRLDVTSASDIAAAVEACGDLRMLINNAGVEAGLPEVLANNMSAFVKSSLPNHIETFYPKVAAPRP